MGMNEEIYIYMNMSVVLHVVRGYVALFRCILESMILKGDLWKCLAHGGY